MALKLPKSFHPDFSRPGVKPTGRVEVDWDNPLSKGLQAFWKLQDLRDLVGTRHGTLYADGYIDVARGYIGDGADDAMYVSETPFHNGDLTIICAVKLNAAATTTQQFFTADSNFGGGRSWQFRAASGVLNFIPFVGGSNGNVTGSTSLSTNTRYVVAATHSSTLASNNCKVYLDGKLDGQGTKAGALDANGAVQTIGARFQSPVLTLANIREPLNGCVEFVAAYNRALSASEIASLSRDPYQILRPSQPMMLFLPAGGTIGYTLNADVNANTLGGDSVSLLANRSLAADVNSLALGADSVTLSSGITLVADVNTLTVGGDDVALTANRLIGADVNALTLGSDGVDLTRGWTFSADVNSLTLGGDDVTLTYTSGATYTLTADAGAYTVSSDGVDLLANRLLTADARAYILSADSVTLSVGVVDTEDCYVWLQSHITDVAYTVSAINVNNYLVSDVDDTAQYLTSAFGAESIYLESCICHCA